MSALLVVVALRKSYAGVRPLRWTACRSPSGRRPARDRPDRAMVGQEHGDRGLSGLSEAPTDGKVVLAGDDHPGRGPIHIARDGLMRTFQTVRSRAGSACADNLAIAHQQFDPATWVDELLRTRRFRDAVDRLGARARTAVELIGCSASTRPRVGIMSYGQKKLVALAPR